MENLNRKIIRKRKHSFIDTPTLMNSTESKIQSVNKFIENTFQEKNSLPRQYDEKIFDTLSDVSTDDSDIEIVKVSVEPDLVKKGLSDKSQVINLDSDNDSENLAKIPNQSIDYLIKSPDYHIIRETNFLNFEVYHESFFDNLVLSSTSSYSTDSESNSVIHLNNEISYIIDGEGCPDIDKNRSEKDIENGNGNSRGMKHKRKRKSKLRFPNNPELQNDSRMFKYWSQRYDLFDRFDMGIKLDKESWYSVTPEYIAKEQAEFCQSSDTLLDGFCGAGGNTIQFAYKCNSVLALDIDPVKVGLTKNNCQVYGVDMNKVSITKDNFFSFAEVYQQSRENGKESFITMPTIHVVFLSPPWGGQNYLNSDNVELTNNTINIEKLMSTARMFSPKMIMLFLPRNTEEVRLHQLLKSNETIKILKHKSQYKKAEKKVKAITALFYINN